MRCPRLLSVSLICLLASVSATLLAQAGPLARVNQTYAPTPARQVPAEAAMQPATEATKLPLSFGKTVGYDSGGGISKAVAMADLDGDGIMDMVVLSGCLWSGDQCFDSVVSVLLGNGDGTFQTAVIYGTGGYSGYAYGNDSIAIRDLNGDGIPDLVVTNDTSGVVGVLLGNGDGTFQAAMTYSTGGSEPDSVAIGDVNGDGIPDLVVANLCQIDNDCNGVDGVVSVLLGNGDGTFQSPVTYDSGGYAAESVALGDLSGNGILDVVVSNLGGPDGEGDSVVGVLMGNGDGTLQTAVDYSLGVQPGGGGVAIGDLNGDGVPDLVVADGYPSVLLGNGDGTFQAAEVYHSGGGSIAIGDINGDGIPDLVMAVFCETGCQQYPAGPGQVDVQLGNGDGTFQSPVYYRSGGDNAAGIAIGDVNGDGRPDVAVVNYCFSTYQGGCVGNGDVGVLLNTFKSATKTSLTSSANLAGVNQSVTFTATITASSAVPNGSTVTFYNGTTEIGTGMTAGGVATLTTSFSTSGKHTIKARYPLDAFHGASSGSVAQVVTPYASTTAVTSSPNPSTYKQAVTLTATVSSGAPGGATGKVMFKNGSTALGTATLSAGTATLTTTKLPVGSLTITADYDGDTQSGKSSGTTEQTVEQ